MELKNKVLSIISGGSVTRMDVVMRSGSNSAKVGDIIDSMLKNGDLEEDIENGRSILKIAAHVNLAPIVIEHEADEVSEIKPQNEIKQQKAKVMSMDKPVKSENKPAPQGSVSQLNQILMQQLERLVKADEASIGQEIERSRAVSQVASEVTKNHAVAVDMIKIKAEQGYMIEPSGLLS